MGVAGLVEVADLVVAGKAPALAQYEPDAGYEGIIRDAESRINWASTSIITYNLIRGCNPAPGAWTTLDGKKLFLFECTQAHRPHLLRGEGQEARPGRGVNRLQRC